MKAQYVFENVRFKRGRNPRYALKIGKGGTIAEIEEMMSNWSGGKGLKYGVKNFWTVGLSYAAARDNLDLVDRILIFGTSFQLKELNYVLYQAEGNNNPAMAELAKSHGATEARYYQYDDRVDAEYVKWKGVWKI